MPIQMEPIRMHRPSSRTDWSAESLKAAGDSCAHFGDVHQRLVAFALLLLQFIKLVGIPFPSSLHRS
jgi:hypothetical protein